MTEQTDTRSPEVEEPAWKVRRRVAWRVRAILVERFPSAFKGPGEPKPPLMIGISAEIMLRCPDLKTHEIGTALKDYCTGTTYLRSFIDGADRINLDGEPVAKITAGEIQNAQLVLRAKARAFERQIEKTGVTNAHRRNAEHKAAAGTASA